MSMMKFLRAALVAVLAFAPLAVEAGPFANRHIRSISDVSAPILPSLDLQFANGEALDALVTFTRASEAFCYDSAGVLQSFAGGVARVNCYVYDGVDWVNLGFLIEESRENLFLRSEELDNVYWGTFGLTVTADQATAPDGTVTADKLTSNGSGPSNIFHTSMGSAAAYTVSIFVEKGDTDYFQITFEDGGNFIAYFDIDTGTVGTLDAGVTATITDIDNGRYRVSATKTQTGAIPISYGFVDADDSLDVANGKFGYAWGAQYELGAFPTSYMGETTSGTITRAADIATVTDLSWFNESAGTMFAKIFPSRIDVQGQIYAIGINNATQITSSVRNISEELSFVILTNSIFQVALENWLTVLAPNVQASFIAAWATNDVEVIWKDEVMTDNTVILPTSLTHMRIGRSMLDTSFINDHITELRFWPVRLDRGYLLARQ